MLREDVLPAPLAGRLETMAGFRNVLAHGYPEVIAERVHETLSHLDDIRAYVAELEAYLP